MTFFFRSPSPDSSISYSPDSKAEEDSNVFTERKDFDLRDYLIKEFPNTISNPNKWIDQEVYKPSPRAKGRLFGNDWDMS